ncbi:MAG TPA: hypothetical protein VGM90_11550 [Kofleriaceae bacterium]|jgi:photosystem II stability/assembly factor-like uncharacterized protein
MRAWVAAAVLATAAPAFGNGRPSETISINFRRGHDADVACGMTFGFVVTHDNGATWRWMCEDALHYNGLFDPTYAYTEPGSIFATTFNGALVNRDGCTFDATAFGENAAVTTLAQGPDGAVYMGLDRTATTTVPADPKLYVSTDDGATFPISANPGQPSDWWESIRVAPSDPQRVYVSGFRVLPMQGRGHLLFRSDDGGHSYQPMGQTGLVATTNTTMQLVGVSATNPDVLYLHLDLIDPTNPDKTDDAIAKSTDGGATWTKILEKNATIYFLARANGDLVASTQLAGSSVSHDGGATWQDLVNPPHINCLSENDAGEVWACTANYHVEPTPMQVEIPSDGYGIMKSTDLATWTPVLHFQDILGPVDCPVGTVQRDSCVDREMLGTTNWCVTRSQLGVTENPTCCPPMHDGEPVSPGCPDPGGGSDDDPSCCGTSSSSTNVPTALLSGVVIGGVLLRRRRRRA